MAQGNMFRRNRTLTRPAPANPITQPQVPTSGFQMPTVQGMLAQYQPQTDPRLAQIDRGYNQFSRSENYLNNNPIASSSTQARQMGRELPADMMNATTANRVNQYSGNPFASTPGQDYARSIPTDMAGMQSRLQGQDPRYAGIRQRFGGVDVAGMQAGETAIASGDAYRSRDGSINPINRAAGDALMQSRLNNSTPQNLMDRSVKPDFAIQNADGSMAATNRLGALRDAVRRDPNNAELRTALDSAQMTSDAATQQKRDAMDEYKAANEGRNPLQVRRDKENARLAEQRQRRMGLVAPKAAAPVENPMKAAIQPDAPNTPENINARNGVRAQLAEASPTAKALGLTGSSSPSEFAAGVMGFNGDVSDDGLRDILIAAKTYGRGQNGESPFAEVSAMYGPDMLEELHSMGEDTPPAKLREWYTKYRSELTRRRQESNRSFADSLPF